MSSFGRRWGVGWPLLQGFVRSRAMAKLNLWYVRHFECDYWIDEIVVVVEEGL